MEGAENRRGDGGCSSDRTVFCGEAGRENGITEACEETMRKVLRKKIAPEDGEEYKDD